ncbi:hypothetical protein BMS3Abin07_00644 [bacterium BMS3Abin07]|nr:hypothetical protein BMS3Abin07_00644 [bacterium BMS3Abin07]GBE32881.1 hypothetical protein BMS3Bbin05_01809 [bacterium BMS3Bbin05]HDO21493.1 hypothetical protein [Nitrospirota bacterium]
MPRVLIISLIAGMVAIIVANKKGRNVLVWFLVSFLFPLSVVILFFMPPLVTQGKTKRCPDCGAIMSEGVDVCRSCNHEMPINMVKCPSCGVIVKDQGTCDSCGKPL